MGNPGDCDPLTGAQVSVGVCASVLLHAMDIGDEDLAAWIRPRLAAATKKLEELGVHLLRCFDCFHDRHSTAVQS